MGDKSLLGRTDHQLTQRASCTVLFCMNSRVRAA